jgi:hypothetical protein
MFLLLCFQRPYKQQLPRQRLHASCKSTNMRCMGIYSIKEGRLLLVTLHHIGCPVRDLLHTIAQQQHMQR